MAQNVNIEEIRLRVEGIQKIGKLSSTFTKLNKNIALTPKELNKAIKSITSYDKRGQRSVNTFNEQIAALKQLKNNVGIGSAAYKRLGKEIDDLSAKYDKLMGKQKKSGGFFKQLGAGAKAGGGTALTASLGRFLPAGAQIGGTAGFLKTGTIAGGVAGAGIGLGVDAIAGLASFTQDAAVYASEIQKLEIALLGVTKNNEDFEKSLEIIRTTSKRLNVPIDVSTKQFTQLAASVLGAGGTIEDAETVFTGVANSIKATGGNAEDVQSAIRAMSQIFGKGKVSAEELQGQLGERLAGAVVKFAEANGSSLEKLQKDLRDGTVGLDQVIKFAEKLNLDFAETAEEIANSQADAGQRLKVRMDDLKLLVGKTVLPIGAAFQETFADIVTGLTNSEGAMKAVSITLKTLGVFAFATVAAVRFLVRTFVDLSKILFHIANFEFKKAFEVIQKGLADTAENARKDYEKMVGIITGAETPDGTTDGTTDGTDDSNPFSLGGDKSPLKTFAQSAFKFAEQAEQAVVGAFKGMEDAMVKFVMTGKLNFRDLANSIISDLTRMLVRYAIVQPLFKTIFPGIKIGSANGNVFSDGNVVPSAMGNVFAKNKIVPYAYGGIVNKPTIFPMANGMGLMGEAGPEAIMPLKRGANGKLGVQSSGGVGNIIVNVDASGSSVQGDSGQGEQFGRALAAAIQSELILQQRPGGLLS